MANRMKQTARVLPLLLGTVIGVLVCAVSIVGTAWSQELKYESWKQVEAASETRDFITKMKGGGDLDAAATAYLEEIVFPQFTLPSNSGDLDELRNRLKTRILSSFANENIQNAANERVVRAMQSFVDDDALELGVRVNAVLMIGELESKAGGLWSGAAAPLAEIVSDSSAALPLRIAAMSGLSQHLSRSDSRSDPSVVQATLESATPALLACLAPLDAETAPADFAALEWLTSQGLRVIPAVMPQAPPEIAAGLFGVLADQQRGLDVRIRAAYALGTTADDRATFDTAEAVAIVESLAREVLATDVALADKRAFERDVLRVADAGPGGFGSGGMMGSDSGFAGMGPMGGMGLGPMGAGSSGLGGMGPMGMGTGEESPSNDRGSNSRSGRRGRGGTAAAGRGPGGMSGMGMGSSMMGSEMGGPGSEMGSGGMMMGPGMMMGSGMPGQGFGLKPGRQSLLEDGICLRTAWRLQTLGNSLSSGDPATAGFVMRAEESEKPAIVEMANTLREQAAAIQKSPTDRSIKAAFVVVAPDLAEPLEDEPEQADENMEEDGFSDTFSSGVFDDSPMQDAADDDSPFGDDPAEGSP